MKKVLFVATVVKAHIMVFHIPYLKWFKENGYETYVCAKNDYENKKECVIPYCDNYYDIPFERSPIKFNNITAFKQLKEIIDSNEFDIIHCHTPMGGVLTRLSAQRTRKNGTKIFYTAHGFHFFKGAPIKNWLMYYPVERFLAKYTDVLITINKEDYERAKKNFKGGRVEYIPGVGIDTENFREVSVDKLAKRREIGVPDDAFVILSVGELNKNKNHELVIRALAKLDNHDFHYVICGKGPLENSLKQLASSLGLIDRLHLLGFRKDIGEICKISDVFCFPSFREGLGLAALEAMAAGLPLITSNVHGIVDYSINGKTGYSFKPTDETGFANAIEKLKNNDNLRSIMGRNNVKYVAAFDFKRAKTKMLEIYQKSLDE